MSSYYDFEIPPGLGPSASAKDIESAEREITNYTDGCLDWSLRESLEELDEVVVEADFAKC